MKYIIILLLILAYFGCVCAQQPDLLRLTMQSDLILFIEMADDVGSTQYKNDFTMEHHVTFRKVERIIKNKYRDDPLRIRAKQPMEGEDYYDENILNGGSSSGVAYMLEYGEKEYRMYFIRRQGEQYVAIAKLYYNFDWEKVIVDIQSVMEIEKEGDPAKRFNMSMQWYKSRNQRPPYGFIAYYKQTGMITDTVRIYSIPD